MREADYDAYDLDDPKHPDWSDQAAERADLERKREKEDALDAQLGDGGDDVDPHPGPGGKEDALPEADRQRILLAPERTQGFPLSRAERQSMSKRERRWLVLFALTCFLVGMFVIVEQARAHPRPLPRAWLQGALCIHSHEGSWTDSGAPHWGGMQMDLAFQKHWAPRLLRRKGTADKWTPHQQLHVAHRAWKELGWSPWPNTRRECGL